MLGHRQPCSIAFGSGGITNINVNDALDRTCVEVATIHMHLYYSIGWTSHLQKTKLKIHGY